MSLAPAERLLETSARLFYNRVILNVGINEIIQRANVARMTLYHHYASKTDLVIAMLEIRRNEREQWFSTTAVEGNSRETLLAVFKKLVSWTLEPGFRGCPLMVAAIELGGQVNAAQSILREHRAFITDFFEHHLGEIGYEADVKEQFAAHLHLLYDGAVIGSFADGTETPAETVLKIVQRLL